MSFNQYFDNLVEFNIATKEELHLVLNICGWSKESLDSILYARTGFNSWNQLFHKEGEQNEHKTANEN